MHADEQGVDEGLVRRLLTEQFPQWAGLPLERVSSAGTDNAIFRLGEDLAVRTPRIHWAAEDPAKEFRWLPRIAPELPLGVPVPVGLGMPDHGYPWHWTVCPWLPGRNAYDEPLLTLEAAAVDLGRFVAALHAIDSPDGPPQDAPSASRGVPLATRHDEVRKALGALRDAIDVKAAAEAWAAALKAPDWDRPPVWIHGDLNQSNLLVKGGRLTGVIDFGGMGVGDPAADLIPAWSLLTGSSRNIYREALRVDDATWARGKGWALSVGLIALPYYVDTNPVIVDWSRRAIEAVLADHSAARM